MIQSYDALADIYEIWAAGARAAERGRPFFMKRYLDQHEGLVVELGVGDGRLAIEAARRGRSMVGVDSSKAMLERCRSRAKRSGVLERLTLIEADFRDFELAEPAALIAIPFHSFLHMLTDADRLLALRQIFGQLRPGGELVFDCFVFDQRAADRFSGPAPRAEFVDEHSGLDVILWSLTRYDLRRKRIRLLLWTDELDGKGVLLKRQYRSIELSWIDAENMRALLVRAGFEVVDLFGDYDGAPFDKRAEQQIWIARRP